MAKDNFGLIGGFVVGIVIVVIGFVLLSGYNANVTISTTTIIGAPNTSNIPPANNTARVLFATTQYSQYANLLYSPSTNRTAYVAAGYNITLTKLANGSVRIMVSAISDSSNNSTFVFNGSDSLYFIDSSLGDDSPPSGDYNLGDDGAVLVNSTGYLTTK